MTPLVPIIMIPQKTQYPITHWWQKHWGKASSLFTLFFFFFATWELIHWSVWKSRVIELQAKGHEKLEEAGRILPWSLQGELTLPKLWFQNPILWNYGGRLYYFVMAALGNKYNPSQSFSIKPIPRTVPATLLYPYPHSKSSLGTWCVKR